jgi:hypothetical protein
MIDPEIPGGGRVWHDTFACLSNKLIDDGFQVAGIATWGRPGPRAE